MEELKCPNCGENNALGTKFCIKCGTKLEIENTNETPSAISNNIDTIKPIEPTNIINTPSESNDNIIEPTIPVDSAIPKDVNTEIETDNKVESTDTVEVQEKNISEPTIPVTTPEPVTAPSNSLNEQTVTNNTESLNYFKYMFNALLKPFNTFKDEEDKLGSLKNVSILSVIIVGIITIISLVTTMINTVRVTSFWTDKTEWVWENLKKVEYFKLIGQNLLIYIGVIIAIASVYFLANLVIKKEAKFTKLLAAAATALIPYAAVSILSPILSMIYMQLGLCITAVGSIYSILILLELMNELIPIENKNTKIYFHLACLSIIVIGGIFILVNLVLGSLTSGLGSLNSLF